MALHEKWIAQGLETSKEMEDLAFNTTDWKMVKESDGIKILKRPCAHMNGRSTFRSEVQVALPAEQFLEMVYPVTNTTPHGLKAKWDLQIEDCPMIEEVRYDMLVVHNKMRPMLKGLVSGRDLIDLCRIQNNGKFMTAEFSSIEHPDYPPNDKYVRAWAYPMGLVFWPNSDDPNKTDVVSFLQTDLKVPAVPIMVLEKGIPTMLIQYHTNLRDVSKLVDQYVPLGEVPAMRPKPE